MVNVYGGRDWSAATRDSSNFLGLLNASSATSEGTFEGLYIVYILVVVPPWFCLDYFFFRRRTSYEYSIGDVSYD